MSRGTFLRWLLVHTAVLGPIVVGLLVLAWRRPWREPAPAMEPLACPS